MSAFVDNLELIEQYSIVLLKDERVRIVLSDELEGDYTINLVFTESSESTEIKTTIDIISSLEITLNMSNFSHAKEVVNLEPIILGTLRDRQLFANYLVMNITRQVKAVLVNFLLKDRQ